VDFEESMAEELFKKELKIKHYIKYIHQINIYNLNYYHEEEVRGR
jgi:hypothetical protein